MANGSITEGSNAQAATICLPEYDVVAYVGDDVVCGRPPDSPAPAERSGLGVWVATVKQLVDDAFYCNRDKKVRTENAERALKKAKAVILVFTREPEPELAGCMVVVEMPCISYYAGFISDVVTSRRFRKNGVQKAVMAAAKQLCETLRFERLDLWTETDNEAACAAYTAGGFVERQKTVVYQFFPN